MLQWRCWLAIGALGVAFQLQAAEWINGVVVKVHDGDTATVATTKGRVLHVRFYGVDAPERATEDWPAQAFAGDATTFMRKLILQNPVSVRLTGERTYRREVGEIFVDGRSATRELVRAGFGWWNTRYAPHDSDLKRLEYQARKTRRGLWRDSKAIPPWRFRKQYRSRTR